MAVTVSNSLTSKPNFLKITRRQAGISSGECKGQWKAVEWLMNILFCHPSFSFSFLQTTFVVSVELFGRLTLSLPCLRLSIPCEFFTCVESVPGSVGHQIVCLSWGLQVTIGSFTTTEIYTSYTYLICPTYVICICYYITYIY